jgi:hypothetical protein
MEVSAGMAVRFTLRSGMRGNESPVRVGGGQ